MCDLACTKERSREQDKGLRGTHIVQRLSHPQQRGGPIPSQHLKPSTTFWDHNKFDSEEGGEAGSWTRRTGVERGASRDVACANWQWRSWSSLLTLVGRLPYDFYPLVELWCKKPRTHLLSDAHNDKGTQKKMFDFESSISQAKGIIPEDGEFLMDTSSASLSASSLSSSSLESN